ncbi:putative Mediator of RNA polymerase II transcription subunit 13 [Drepanopeziza brunnea f. sp. 'multigermtubi' MB_m1]|uniref:Mediator of RNA polymerase II transcription subunit 13 n=1 Tax=Marssonina brunnea f. sp. multigermtubi (strain MB_m1) TaxID=1072389 RepID=K1WD03_MARBU|nr:putative Mediator of RNA polymerase II transcription subunit 13 [Drepanopeziza brunnea f. sp. 'multigermtubi' MB_m1]EKD15260.1 putative Mediator of RNA polymerase II transcription subunit 13 [Drepanopeziza brunnea f. sp. 'multigermtubi' MB_m1]
MELSECPTNVIACSNFASVQYEYFESQTGSPGVTKQHLQRIERGWRHEGKLVHYDSSREGIWMFQTGGDTGPLIKHSDQCDVDIQGLGIFQKDKGTYEPASLARSSKQASNAITTPNTSSSPSSSSLENALRNVQALNARSVQTNSNLGLTQESSTPSPGAKTVFVSLKDIHEYFISSVLSSIVYFLCHDHDFIPLNSRTLIMPSSESLEPGVGLGNGIELATLDISLTSLGVLVIKAHTDTAPGLQTSVNTLIPGKPPAAVSLGAALWLAPSGSAARLYSVPDDKPLPGNLPVSQIQEVDSRLNGIDTLTITSWKSKCLEWLSTMGLESKTLEASGWLYVQIIGGHLPYFNADTQAIPMLEELAIVPWPAILCFQTSSTETQDSNIWISGSFSYRDPLLFAEEWFTSREERAATVSKRQKERQAHADALLREQADTDARALQSHTYYPAALRRSSNAGAMYPTPPDAPQPHIGATPSFDGNVSTPGNQSHAVAHDTSGIQPSNPIAADVDTDMWAASGKRQRMSSGNTYNDNDNDNDNDNENDNSNLFGDLGGDMFGTHITDDDFNFFDEPDLDEFDHKTLLPPPGKLPDVQNVVPLAKKSFLNDTMETLGPVVSEMSLKAQDDRLLEQKHEPNTKELKERKPQISIPDHANFKVETATLPPPSINLPFNKEIIFHRLAQESIVSRSHEQPRRKSVFNQVYFEDSLQSVNEKYGPRGQFNFTLQRKSPVENLVDGLPQTAYFTSRRKTHEKIVEVSKIAQILGEKETCNSPKIDDPMEYLTASVGGSPISEQDDSSHTTEEPLTSPTLGLKRKWEGDDKDDITSTFDALAMEFEHSAGTPQSVGGSQMHLLDADPAAWALNTYFSSPEPATEPNTLSDLECIAGAQVLADQAISGTLRLPGSATNEPAISLDMTFTTRQLIHRLSKAAKSCLKDGTTCTLRSFLDIQGIPALNQALRLPPRPMSIPRAPIDSRPNNIFPIPPPQIEVRRSESKLSILPASVPFWENLGLAPSTGTKDVDAVCVYPNFEGLAANATTFLDQMRSVYESSRFGIHDRLVTKDIGNGLLPYTIDLTSQNRMQHLTSLMETAARLSKNFASSPVSEKNFVVYFVYPIDNSVLLVHICSAFQHLFNLYRKALSERRANAANELVLQLVPLDFIASPTSMAIPLPSKCFQLSMEVYDRCMDFASSSSSPAIVLEQPLPRTIDFKINTNPSASLLHENTCLHIAYAHSIDDRWITAAWTDNRGTRQMTASYCLGRRCEPVTTPFVDIANEIWQTTLQVISGRKIHWRIFIAKIGVMDASELDFWTGLASTESNAQISLTLVTVQTDPSLRLLPPYVTLAPNGTAAQSVLTPVSTPQALQSSTGSPDNASTPVRGGVGTGPPAESSVEPDSDARLIDHTDQSWGAILSHRLNNSNSLMEVNPALISGYLLKRGGVNIDDPPIIMEVNILHSEVVGNPRTFHESLLRELLGYYRGLGTIARTRGLVDAVKDVRPWHIAAAEKAVKALYMSM